MNTFVIPLSCMAMNSRFSNRQESTPRRDWFAIASVVGIVTLLHLAVLSVWWMLPEAPAVQVSEMTISFSSTQMQLAQTVPLPKPKPVPHEPEQTPSEEQAVKEQPQSVQLDAAPPSPVVLDTEPDYKADYLNNPRPPYPMAASRMGYHGKVVLNVEVLADGKAGQVLIYSSSGHDILDSAALQTLKTWRFTPARHLGQPVTRWFLVPFNFTLKDIANE